MQWYARQVANYPSLIILFVLAIALTCVIISLKVNDLPTFEEPIQGFESRGTVLSQRATAWIHLENHSAHDGSLTTYPTKEDDVSYNRIGNLSYQSFSEFAIELNNRTINVTSENHSKSERHNFYASPWTILENEDDILNADNSNRNDDITFGIIREKEIQNHQNQYVPGKNEFFCNDPERDYARVVFQSVNGNNLFTAESLRSICKIDEKLRHLPEFENLCVRTPQRTCCRSWSLPNYVALLCNLSSCHEISEESVTYVTEFLKSCAIYYYNVKLNHECTSNPVLCRDAPKQCRQFNAVYNIMHYFTDINFFTKNSDFNKTSKLTYTMVFLPIVQRSTTLNYYMSLEKTSLSDGVTEVVAMKLGSKQPLFDDYLLHDTIYVGLAAAATFLLLWMYSASFFVTLMTFMAIVFSLSIAYFIYTIVYQISFFPFMNVLSAVIAIGIGADDACIYCKVWLCAKAEKNNGTLVKLVRDTLHHSCLSTFATTITTAVAFFASFTSSVTAIRCFSIFAGTAVLANFLFTITWIPASIVIAEKWCSSSCCLCIPPFGIYLPQFQRFWCCSSVCNTMWKLHYSFTDSARVFFEKILPCLIIKPRLFWLFLFGSLAVGGTVVVFYYPSLSLPDSKEFQIFSDNHPFEKYGLTLKNLFRFEREKEQLLHRLSIIIVWGVLPIDNGNYLNPFDKGHLVFDPSFNIAAPSSQRWFLSFCKQLRNQSFYQPSPYHSSICFIEHFKKWMKRRCIDMSDRDQTPCCKTSKFPYKEEVFNKCVKEAMRLNFRGKERYINEALLPRLSKDTGEIKAIVVESNSAFTYSVSFNDMYKFKTSVDTWVTKIMETAPEGIKNGWFISDLDFFDLQDSLARGTSVAIGVAIGVSFISLLVTTLNLLISIYAIITIACIIIVTIASLVLLGWKLNVLESITVSVAIGLAVDLTLHYGVAYRLSPHDDRESSVIFSLSRVGSPIAMAAFTSFMAGVLMFPSVILAYQQIGTFLVLLMSISWVYATFFFQSLLSIAGPRKGQLQLNYPTVHCCKSSATPVEKTQYALSESTLSTSSASCPVPIPTSESHELEPLTNVKGTWAEFMKQNKKKHRQRSGSFSAAFSRNKDPSFNIYPNKYTRKISLPIVNITNQTDSCIRHISGATSSTTIVCTEESIASPHKENESNEIWCKREISV